MGSVSIPPADVFRILLGGEGEKAGWSFILWESRLPQALTALLCGGALAVCGLMLQTAFKNPLAGPSILGINAGASLGVAFVMLLFGGSITAGAFSLSGFFSVLLGAFIGAMLIMALILSFHADKEQYHAADNGYHDRLHRFFGHCPAELLCYGRGGAVLYDMGAGQLRWSFPTADAGLCAGHHCGTVRLIIVDKAPERLVAGRALCRNLGVNICRVRNWLLIITGLLTAVTTAFCGPVAFIGLAVPHVARMILGTANHNSLLPVTILSGGAVALLCNLICVMPGEAGIIPLNAVTPIIGAPVIIYVILSQRKPQQFN